MWACTASIGTDGEEEGGRPGQEGRTAKKPEPAPAPKIRGFWIKVCARAGRHRRHEAATARRCWTRDCRVRRRGPCPRTFDDLHVLEIDDGKPLYGGASTSRRRVASGRARTDHAAAAAAEVVWVMGGQDPVGRAEAGCDSQYLPFDAGR